MMISFVLYIEREIYIAYVIFSAEDMFPAYVREKREEKAEHNQQKAFILGMEK